LVFNASVELSNDEVEIRSPNFNLPASTWTLLVRSSALKSAQDTANEKLIGWLVNFQASNGSFVFNFVLMDPSAFFGKPFVDAIETLKTSKILVQSSSKNAAILAGTIATIVLLEVRFQSCKDLWVLAASKARLYVDAQIPEDDREDLYKLAKSPLLLDLLSN
jgi:hypothetical protein